MLVPGNGGAGGSLETRGDTDGYFARCQHLKVLDRSEGQCSSCALSSCLQVQEIRHEIQATLTPEC